MSEIDEKALEAAVNAYCASIGHRSDMRGPLRQIRDAAITAAIRTYLNSAPSPAQAGTLADANPSAQVQDAGAMPSDEAICRLLCSFVGDDPDRLVGVSAPDELGWHVWRYRCPEVRALLQPAFAALAQEVRYSRQLADAYRRQAEDAQRSLASAREEERAGTITWHSSEQDGGPDCGIAVDLGNGKSLYIGAMAGHAEWQIALIDGDAMCALADVTNTDLARNLADHIAAAIRAQGDE